MGVSCTQARALSSAYRQSRVFAKASLLQRDEDSLPIGKLDGSWEMVTRSCSTRPLAAPDEEREWLSAYGAILGGQPGDVPRSILSRRRRPGADGDARAGAEYANVGLCF